MFDRFAERSSALDAPATHAFAITPDDAGNLVEITRAIYVSEAGSLAVVMMSGDEVSFGNLAAGTMLPVRVQRVKSTGTTAAGLLGLV